MWFGMVLLQLHPDNSRSRPADWQQEPRKTTIEETVKHLTVYKEHLLEATPRAVTRESNRLASYCEYLKTAYKDTVTEWEVQCELRCAKKQKLKEKIGEFDEFKDCETLAQLDNKYLASFVEKDTKYEDKMKTKQDQDQEDKERSFQSAFGSDSSSDDD
jgi:hypothetical protein